MREGKSGVSVRTPLLSDPNASGALLSPTPVARMTLTATALIGCPMGPICINDRAGQSHENAQIRQKLRVLPTIGQNYDLTGCDTAE